MATSVLPSPIRLCAMDRCDLSPAKRIAIGPSQNQRPSKCSSADLVDTDSSTSSLSTDGLGEDESLISLLRSVPQKKASPSLRKFTLYPTLVEVYTSLSNGKPLLARTAEMLEDRNTKRRVYQTLFEVMHRKSAPPYSCANSRISQEFPAILHLVFHFLCRPQYYRGNADREQLLFKAL